MAYFCENPVIVAPISKARNSIFFIFWGLWFNNLKLFRFKSEHKGKAGSTFKTSLAGLNSIKSHTIVKTK